MKRLSVNLDHVATLRELRGTVYPSLTAAAQIVRENKADGLTLHLRQDRRHIQESDVWALGSHDLPLTLEMACVQENVNLALQVKPHAVTFVPEKKEEKTTEGGLSIATARGFLSAAIPALQEKGIRVCLFLEPDAATIEEAKNLGCDIIEIHTGAYAEARAGSDECLGQLKRIKEAAAVGRGFGLQMNAGHGLHYENTSELVQSEHLSEFSIGHAIVCRALFVGLPGAVAEMRKIIAG